MTKHLTKPIRAIHFMVLAFLMTLSACVTENKIQKLEANGNCEQAEKLISEKYSGQKQLYHKAMLYITCENNRAKGIPILKKLASANYIPALGRLVEYNLATSQQHIKYSQLKNEAEQNAKEKKLKRMETLANIGRYGSGALGRQSSKNSETKRSSDSVTCFAQGDYISGSYKTCKYDCMGSAYSLSIDATDICPLTVDD